MNSLIQDVLNASMAFVGVELMNKPNAQDNLMKAANVEVMEAEIGFSVNAPGGMPTPVHRFVLQRDRISLDIASARSSVTKEYLSQTSPSEDIAHLAKIVACAIDNTEFEEQQLNAYGYNMMIVFSPDLDEPVAHHLGHHLFASYPFGREDWERIGGLGTLYFSDSARRWTFHIESRPRGDFESKRLHMSINLHVPDSKLPDEDAIKDGFNEVLEEANRLMNQLLTAGN